MIVKPNWKDLQFYLEEIAKEDPSRIVNVGQEWLEKEFNIYLDDWGTMGDIALLHKGLTKEQYWETDDYKRDYWWKWVGIIRAGYYYYIDEGFDDGIFFGYWENMPDEKEIENFEHPMSDWSDYEGVEVLFKDNKIYVKTVKL